MIVRLLSHHSCPLVSVNYYTQKRRSRLHCSARDTDFDQMQILTKYQGNESFPKLTFKSELLRTEIRTGLFMFGNFSSMRGQTAKNATETLATQASSTRKRPFDNGTSDTSILSTKLA